MELSLLYETDDTGALFYSANKQHIRQERGKIFNFFWNNSAPEKI
jgi:hypothetical protein